MKGKSKPSKKMEKKSPTTGMKTKSLSRKQEFGSTNKISMAASKQRNSVQEISHGTDDFILDHFDSSDSWVLGTRTLS